MGNCWTSLQPWGGINVIFCGDFFQLPPVPDSENGQPLPVTFAFDAESWDRTVHASISLKKVFRQKDEDMLNATRVGQLTDAHVAKFRQLQRPVCCPEGIEPAEM
ncbi:hypothetical protein BDW22DRAFT_1355407 [Trametopsis cervina]|nr:hypothetical protein BDW22DRAFT_1355407 [Trametopsis cervina]